MRIGRRHARHRYHRHRPRQPTSRRRIAAWIGGGALVVVLALGGWLYFDLSRVRADLTSARNELLRTFADPVSVSTPDGRHAALATVDKAVGTLAAARRKAQESKVFSLVRTVPGVGSQRDGLLELIDDATAGTAAVRDLLVHLDDVATRTQVQDGHIPDAGLGELTAEARTTAAAILATAKSDESLWGPLGAARSTYDAFARSSADRLSQGADAVAAARTFMGGAGDRRYLLAMMNNAEMRDQGMVLSYAVAQFSGGQLTFRPGGSIHDISLDQPAPTEIPAGTRQVFGDLRPTQVWQSVNATADWGWSGRTLVDMYTARTGEAVDGVIAVDVPAIAGLLRAVGPVSIASVPEPLTSDNVGRIVLHDLYDGLAPGSDQTERRDVLADVVGGVMSAVTSGSRDTIAVGRELGASARGGHLRLWSANGGEEQVFERSGLGGGPATAEADRTFHVAVENRTATKLDYYVKPSVTQVVTVKPNGDAVVDTTVTVENTAPEGAGPSYQLGPDEFTAAPGDYRAWVLLWGPAGATQQGSVAESGLTLSQRVVPVSAGKRFDVSFETVLPHAVRDGHLRVRLVPQPRLEPVPFDVRLRLEGWNVEGDRSRSGVLDRTWVLDWKVRR